MRRSLVVVLVALAALFGVSVHERSKTGDLLPISFAHADHRDTNCIACHHDFADRTGNGFCIDCHRRDPALGPLIEAQFHALCMGCHVEKRAAGEDAGPTRVCFDCHHAEDRP